MKKKIKFIITILSLCIAMIVPVFAGVDGYGWISVDAGANWWYVATIVYDSSGMPTLNEPLEDKYKNSFVKGIENNKTYLFKLDSQSKMVRNKSDIQLESGVKCMVDSEGYVCTLNGDKIIIENEYYCKEDGTRLNANEMKQQTDHGTSDTLSPVVLFSTLEQLKPKLGEDTYDFFGIYMTSPVSAYSGNKDFLGSSDGTANFLTMLSTAKYDSSVVSSFIEELKKILEIADKIFGVNSKMILDKDANEARYQRSESIKATMILQTFQVILRILGVILIFYGFCIAIAGVIDETGMLNNYCTSAITNGKMSPERPLNSTERLPEELRFRISYIFVAVGIVLIGLLCLSPSLQGWILDKFWLIINGIKNLINTGNSSVK